MGYPAMFSRMKGPIAEHSLAFHPRFGASLRSWVSPACLALAAAMAAGCSGDDELRKAGLAEGCLVNTDCENPLICAFRRCHKQCADSRDCPAGQRCVISDRPAFVCQLDDERQCTYHSQCAEPQICAADGQCRNQCASDRDCVPGQQCANGTCAETTEVDPGGNLIGRSDASPAGEPCVYHSDCATTGYKCISGYCRLECMKDVDCATGERCVSGACVAPVSEAGADAASDAPEDSEPGKDSEPLEEAGPEPSLEAGPDSPPEAAGDAPPDVVAEADASTGCFYNSDCADSGPGWICRFGTCVPQCKAAVDCDQGQECVNGQCVLILPDGSPDGYLSSCQLDSDCPAPLVCGAGGKCTYECVAATDCNLAGACCIEHMCVTGLLCLSYDAGVEDAVADGPCGCVDNLACDDGLFCNGAERCVQGCCAPALETPCDSHSSCIEDSCDEGTKSCMHNSKAPEDFDKDGHLSFDCSGDDCDDKDPTSFTGASELCDQKDNDCNGLVDDQSRRPYGLEFVLKPTMVTNNTYGHGRGAPLGDGWVVFWGDVASNVYELGDLYGQTLDASGVPMAAAIKLRAGGGTRTSISDAAGEQLSAAVVYTRALSYGALARYVSIFKSDLSLVQHTTLAPEGNGAGDSDIVWTGSQYVIGYGVTESSITRGSLIGFKRDGTVSISSAQVPTANGTGVLSQGNRIRVAWSGSTIAAAYHDASDTQLKVSIFSSGGSLLVGPVPVVPATPGPKLLGIGGTTNGYVAVYLDGSVTKATFIAIDGKVGNTVTVPNSAVPLEGWGDTDGDGAMFGIQYGTGLRFGYARGDLASGFELSAGLTPASADATDVANIASNGAIGTGLRVGIFYSTYDGRGVMGRPVGCAP